MLCCCYVGAISTPMPDTPAIEHRTDIRDVEQRVSTIADTLRASGHRVTPQRMAIIRNFVARADHPSVDAIYADLRDGFPMMAASTVYNTLRTLVELGEAVEVSPATPEARFDSAVGDHYHLVCLRCRKIVDVAPDQRFEELSQTILGREPGFEPLVQIHQVMGYCAACSAEVSEAL